MTKKTTPNTSERDQHELENAPYLLKGSRIERNYELLPTTHRVDNNLILDYIDCNDAAEAKRLRGWLWNAFAGGRLFGNYEAKKEKMPVELNISAHDKRLLSVKFYPVKTKLGNIDQWYSVTVYFRYPERGDHEGHEVSMSGQTVEPAIAVLMADAIKLAADAAAKGAVDFKKCVEVTKEQNAAYWDERKAEKEAREAARRARQEAK